MHDRGRTTLVTLCTGNAARSVMAGAVLHHLGVPSTVVTAGTHVVEHQPMSIRTRAALDRIGVAVPRHRSHQLTDSDVAGADLVLAMAAEHVRYVRRRHPAAAARTATVVHLERHLAPDPAPLAERVAALRLDDVDPDGQGDVVDPAGGDDADYLACAVRLHELLVSLAPRLA